MGQMKSKLLNTWSTKCQINASDSSCKMQFSHLQNSSLEHFFEALFMTCCVPQLIWAASSPWPSHPEQIMLLSADMCDVWVCDECPWSTWVRDSVTNMLPHTSIWAYTTASKRRGRWQQFHIYLFCLDLIQGAACLCLSLFEQDVCVWVCPCLLACQSGCIKR